MYALHHSILARIQAHVKVSILVNVCSRHRYFFVASLVRHGAKKPQRSLYGTAGVWRAHIAGPGESHKGQSGIPGTDIIHIRLFWDHVHRDRATAIRRRAECEPNYWGPAVSIDILNVVRVHAYVLSMTMLSQ